jgi:MoCo/4Fe-4S cofactor protein with predicted Tat translocation signal
MIELDVITRADVAADGQPRQWRSLAQHANAPALAELATHEFHPDGAAADEPEDASRRSFMKTMGASVALAGLGLSGCRRPFEKVVPYVRRPEEVIPGIANYYATAMPLGGVVHPLLVESNEGRPTKVEGNPEHPVSRGKSSVLAQASVLNLYDPDRARFVRRQGAAVPFGEFVAFARQIGAGSRLAVLAEPTSSPTVARLRADILARFPGAHWVTYRSAADLAAARRPLVRFSQAQTVVSFDADFLDDPVTGVWNAREFAEGRRVHTPEDTMNRLYVIESTMTPTGGMADHRLRMRASDIPAFAQAVATALGQGAGAPAPLVDARAAAFAEAIAEDARQGTTVFVAGATQPASVHALCTQLNAATAGGAVTYVANGFEDEAPFEDAFPALVAEMNAGRIDLLLMIGANPVYDAPAAVNFAEALERVPAAIHLGHHRDETAQRCMWSLPRAHYLEAWGDGRALDGTLSVIQPLIAPLYADAHSEVEVLNLLATGELRPGYELVRETFGGQIAGAFEDGWRTLLHDGFLPGSATAPLPAPTFPEGFSTPARAASPDDIELVVRPDPRLHDGAFSNNAWMLEMPHPVSKTVWDNVAVMSRTLADRLGVRFDDAGYEGGVVQAGKIHASRVTITAPGGGQATLPVWVQPGHPDNSITVHTGWGRALSSDRTPQTDRGLFDRLFTVDTDKYRLGPISNEIGRRTNHLRSGLGTTVVPSVGVDVTPGRHLVASTQDHGSMEGRPILRMATYEEFRQRPLFAQEAVGRINDVPWEEYPPIWGEESSPPADPRIGEAKYSDHQWGMTIDLNVCSGCNACVAACQSENNIPIVGKSEVSRGREMHWLRLDRYYVGDDPVEAGMAVMPMMCQHCEYAPCESVCPVAATTHSPDGLNEMTYNRCIGTRYCSNNCPYKIRRYNWFNWNKTLPQETRMQLNPRVTPRFRGVMEKCTWCIHRIRNANYYAHLESRKIADGEVQTACQQACPSDAIVFGDLTDPDSRVSQLKRTARRYEVLEEYNIKPRLSYLARLSNPNPRLLAALGQPAGTPSPEPPSPPRVPGPTPAERAS